MTDKLRFAVVGCGVIGRQHASVISANGDLGLSVLVDVVPDRAKQLADQVAESHGCSRPAVTASLEDALARSDVDAVAVCTPSGLHADVAVAALRSGRHVVVEKPLDVTLANARRVAEAASAAPPGVLAAVISQHRYDPGSRAIHEAIASGRFGRITSAVASLAWWRSQEYYDSGEWRGTWALDGGGALMNQGVHTLDLLVWFLGRPVEIHAHTALLAHERVEVEDTAVATIRFESGALATVHATTAAYPGLSARLQVHGTRGSAILDNDRLVYFHAADAGSAASDYGAAGSGNQAEAEVGAAEASPRMGEAGDLFVGHSRQYADIASSIAEGRPSLVTVQQATLALATVRAVYHSMTTGQPVLLDDVLASRDNAPVPDALVEEAR